MEKLTTDNPQTGMEYALNLFYIQNRETWARGMGEHGENVTLNNFVRMISLVHPEFDLDISDDNAIAENMHDLMEEGITSNEGIVAMLYQTAWAFSMLRKRLKYYEDLEFGPSIIRALEKQIPQELDYESDGYDENGNLIYDIARCRKCGYEFEECVNDWGSKFCPECGQALNWEET